MHPTAQFDPASLHVQLDLPFFERLAHPDSIQDFAHFLIRNDITSVRREFGKLSGNSRSVAAMLSAAFWHEQRHFVDFTLTNYGAFRTRNFFLIYANMPELFDSLNEAELPLLLPIHVYKSPKRYRPLYRALGLTSPIPDNIIKVVDILSERREFLEKDGYRFTSGAEHSVLGGEAQLEALAWMTQLGAVESLLGYNSAIDVQARMRSYEVGQGVYCSIERFLANFGLFRYQPVLQDALEIPGLGRPDLSLMIPLLFASLCCRKNLSRLPDDSPIGQLAASPAGRMCALVNELAGRRIQAGQLSMADAWAEVNVSCKKMWDLDIIDEIELDLELQQDLVSRSTHIDCPGYHVAWNAYRDLAKLRLEMFGLFVKDPVSFMGIISYCSNVLPLVLPLVLLCANRPQPLSPPVEDYKPVHHNGAVWWSACPSDLDHVQSGSLRLREREAWETIAAFLAPAARVLEEGRTHRMTLACEPMFGEHFLCKVTNHGIAFYWPYEYPRRDRSAEDLYRYYGINTLQCDFTCEELKAEDAVILSRWDFIRYPQLAERLSATRFPFPGLEHFDLRNDWSLWVVHKRFCPD